MIQGFSVVAVVAKTIKREIRVATAAIFDIITKTLLLVFGSVGNNFYLITIL
jgi:hypothetical protein